MSEAGTTVPAGPAGERAPRRQRSRRGDQNYHSPATVEDLTRQNIETIARLNQAAQAERTPADRIADAVANFCGSMIFVWVHVFWFGGWVVVNTAHWHFGGRAWHFDPYPFPLLTLVTSLEAIFLSTFILVSQKRGERLADRRNHLDLQVNLLAEQENSKMLVMLEAILKRLGIPDCDPEVRVLEESTRPDKLVQQIEEIIEKDRRDEKTGRR